MLKVARVADTKAAHRLLQLWAERYLPELSILPTEKNQFPVAELVDCATQAGRSQTVRKMRSVLQLKCELAGLETNSLFTYVPNIVNLAQARRLVPSVRRVYEKVFEIYQQQQPPSAYLKYIDVSSHLFSKLALPSIMLPLIHQLAEDIQPVLLQLQEQYFTAQDSRTVGFLTTQFHFSNKNILQQLTPCEQVLITPYLTFIEEQICIPWQRICAAATSHPPSSPYLTLVEQLLPESHAVARATYNQAVQLFPTHRSRRGTLSRPAVAASTLRDLHMFQGYLWLCVLEDSMHAIEQELLPLCIAVFPNVGVKWELVEQMLRSLEHELFAKLSPLQKQRLSPYTGALRTIFDQHSLNSAGVLALDSR